MKIIVSLIFFFSFLNTNSLVSESSSHAELAFINPLYPNAVVLSNFGLRTHPILKEQRMHFGVDFRVKKGDQVKASAKGKVLFADYKEKFGNFLILEHANGFVTRYAHLENFHNEIKKGSEVEQGQVIGFAGESGLTSAPVLHFEILLDGEAKNPLLYLE